MKVACRRTDFLDITIWPPIRWCGKNVGEGKILPCPSTHAVIVMHRSKLIVETFPDSALGLYVQVYEQTLCLAVHIAISGHDINIFLRRG
jgi:hypothetical protein